MKDFWLPVFGGPRDGCTYYDGLDPVPGRRVFLGEPSTGNGYNLGHYEIASHGRSVVWVGRR